MRKKSINLIVSLIFFFLTVGAFYWLWTQANRTTSSSSSKAKTYTAVEIEAVKTQATEILGSLEKNSDIPLTTPTAKMGRTNPFTGL